MFSPKIHGAITTYYIRKKKLKARNDITDYVLILFISNLSERATINLALSLKEGT